MAEKKTNCLGLDKFQTAIIKRNYQTVKPFITKRDKALEKMNETIRKAKEKYEEELDMVEMQIETYDNITKSYTKKSCGYELTSAQCMEFIENPELFEQYKQENPIETEMEFQEDVILTNGDNNARDLDSEEDKEWEDRIVSGELKEIV